MTGEGSSSSAKSAKRLVAATIVATRQSMPRKVVAIQRHGNLSTQDGVNRVVARRLLAAVIKQTSERQTEGSSNLQVALSDDEVNLSRLKRRLGLLSVEEIKW